MVKLSLLGLSCALALVLPYVLVDAHLAPQPRPSDDVLVDKRQTSRHEILERARIQQLPHRRQESGVTYPTCDPSATNINAAVYVGSGVSEPNIDTTTATSVDDCIQQCLSRTDIGCHSGDWDSESGQCWMASSFRPGVFANTAFSAFALYTDCTSFQPYAYPGADCCNY